MKDLLTEIDAFLAENPMTDYRFGIRAISNGRLVERLRAGGRIWPENDDRVRQFMRTYKPEKHRHSPVAA